MSRKLLQSVADGILGKATSQFFTGVAQVANILRSDPPSMNTFQTGLQAITEHARQRHLRVQIRMPMLENRCAALGLWEVKPLWALRGTAHTHDLHSPEGRLMIGRRDEEFVRLMGYRPLAPYMTTLSLC